MICPRCSSVMSELSKWECAPFGGYICRSCNLRINKKNTQKIFFKKF